MNLEQQIEFVCSLYAVFLNSAGRYKEFKSEIQSALLDRKVMAVWRKSGSEEDYAGILKQASTGKNVELKPLGKTLKMLIAEQPDMFSPAVTKLVQRFSLYFRAGTEGAAKGVQAASSSVVFPTWVRSAFEAKSIDQGNVTNELAAFVKKHGGKGSALDREAADELKASDPEEFRVYTRLRREFQQAWKNAASNFVRKSGEETVPMKDLLKYLNDNGMKHGILPGFTGRVNADLEWYDNDNNRIAGVPSTNVFTKVQMNPDPKPGKYVFTAVPPEGSGSKPKYFFRAKDLRERRDAKFAMVAEVAPIIEHARKVWLSGIRNFRPEDVNTVAAVCIELAYQFASRIGTPGNSTKGQSTYGLSTILVKHIRFSNTGFVITYPGKDGIKASHKYVANDATSRMILGIMKDLVDGKQPTDPVFTVSTRNGFVPLRVPVVTRVFRKVVGHPDITIHKIRTLKGTVLFNDLVDQYISKNRGKTPSPENVVSQWKTMGEAVGKELNHVRTSADGEQKVTHATALAAYIDVSAQQRLFDAFNIPYPASLLKALGKHRLESALMVLAAEGEDDEGLDESGEEAPEEEDPEASEEPLEPDDSVDTGEPLTDESADDGAAEDAPEDEPEEEPTEEEKPKDEPKKEPKEEELSDAEKERIAAEESSEDDSKLLTTILENPEEAEDR